MCGGNVAAKGIMHSVGLMTSVVARTGILAPPMIADMVRIVGATITAVCVLNGANIDVKGTTHTVYLSLN